MVCSVDFGMRVDYSKLDTGSTVSEMLCKMHEISICTATMRHSCNFIAYITLVTYMTSNRMHQTPIRRTLEEHRKEEKIK